MQSTRLPGKILLPLPLWGDKPMLSWIVEALKASVHPSDIFIATSTNTENDVLENFCKIHEIHCFRGDEDDVLSRFIAILKHKRYGTAVRLTADNPIVDANVMDETISYHIAQRNDYTNTETLPIGMNFEVIRPDALIELDTQKLTKADKEHVTLFLKNNKRYKKSTYFPKINNSLSELRLTVDYASDLLVASSLIAFFEKHDLKGLQLVEKVHHECPFLFEANNTNFQKRQFSDIKEELTYTTKMLKELELNRSAAILSSYGKENSI